MKKLLSSVAGLCVLIMCLNFNSASAQSTNYDSATATRNIVFKEYPGEIYYTIGTIKKGAKVKIFDATGMGWDQVNSSSADTYGWSQVKYNGMWGYVKTHELKFSSPYKWTPYMKERTLNQINEEYVGKKDKTKLVKVKLDKGQTIGYYAMYVQLNGKGKWNYLVTINCKTGWYHG